jgi:NADH-quinone oxidoreductase subunit D
MSAPSDPPRSATAVPLRSATLSERLGFRPAVVELGHAHASVRRVMAGVGATTSFLVTLDDDRIEALEVEIGLGHRGFEHEVESRPFVDALPYVARLGHASGVLAQVAYGLALERLLGLTAPPRAVWLRTLACELARVTDHLARVAALASSVAASDAERIVQQGEVVAMRLLTGALGGSPLAPWVRPAGVRTDLPKHYADAWKRDRAGLDATLARVTTLLLEHPNVVLRLADVAALAPADAQALGVTGPCLRATGAERDLRRDAPYLAYQDLDFDVATGTTGDDFDRLAVVVEEIRQSLRIVDQCLERLEGAELAGGAIVAGAAGAAAGPKEGLIESGALVVPAGEALVAIESSTGELGFLLVSDGSARPRRIRCRAPSFFHARALQNVLVGARLDDLLPTAALFHLVSGECDR